MLKQVIFSINLNIGYVQGLVGDIPEEQFADQPSPGTLINHPAWILGHLCISNDEGCLTLGKKTTVCPPSWEKLFGFGSEPLPDRSLYASKQEFLDTFASSAANLVMALQTATPQILNQPMQGPMASFFPTVGEYAVYDATAHAGMHLGQLTTWRRLKGFPRLF